MEEGWPTSRISAVLALAVLATVVAFASFLEGGSATSPRPIPAAGTPPCPAPTPAPGEPSPTPPPTPHPTEFDVLLTFTFVNELGQSASDLHVCFDRGLGMTWIDSNAPDCQTPTVTHKTRSNEVAVVWPAACVDPGESVKITVATPGSALVRCSFWTLFGSPLSSCPSGDGSPTPTLTPSPTPTATGATDACEPRGTPPVTHPPTPTPATPTATPGPTSRDMIFQTTIPFCNDAGQSASDLHIHFAFPYSGRTLKANPPGCPEPAFQPTPYGLDTFDLDVDWGTDCVDPGESLTIEFIYACGDVPCNTPQPFCYTWTRFGEPVFQGDGDCPAPTPTPTPTPTPFPEIGQGDVNCTHLSGEGGGVSAVDALAILVYVAGLTPLDQNEPCPEIGAASSNGVFGDVDCSGVVTAVDALKVLRHVAGLPVLQPPSCPPIGAWPATGT